MTNYLLPIAVLGALALAQPASADGGQLVCAFKDQKDNALLYTFTGNTAASRDAGTFVEIAFERNGVQTVAEVGKRPVWSYEFVNGELLIRSQAAPDWYIKTGAKTETGAFQAALFHTVKTTVLKQQPPFIIFQPPPIAVASTSTTQKAVGVCGFQAPQVEPSQERLPPELLNSIETSIARQGKHTNLHEPSQPMATPPAAK